MKSVTTPPGRPELLFSYEGAAARLTASRIASAVYLRRRFRIPRPRALTGDVHFAALVRLIVRVRRHQEFRSFRFEAAGSGSTVFLSLAALLERELGIPFDPDEGELVLKVRHAFDAPDEWEVAVRLTPRPLSVREWRVQDYRGALNGTTPTVRDRFLNVMCGSGTLLIERLLRSKVARCEGIDSSDEALRAAHANITAANFSKRITITAGDATELPFADHSFDVCCADLPWGERIGSRARNRTLYGGTLTELGRVIVPKGRLVLLTQHIDALDRALAQSERTWIETKRCKVSQGGFTPTCLVLHRRTE
jgi:16S rRNA G966 N2-methylase RsmD